MVRRALTRQTRWYQNRCSTFKIKDCIVQKPFWKILEFWPLVTSILTWAKKWPKWFRNAVFRFVLRCAGAEIDGGCSNTTPPPPPPSRWWKIQRPSRARVKRRTAFRSPTSSTSKIRSALLALLANCASVSPRTVSRRLVDDFYLKSHKLARKFRLRPAMKVKRLRFAKKHVKSKMLYQK